MPEEKKKQSLLVSFLSVSSSKFIKYGIQDVFPDRSGDQSCHIHFYDGFAEQSEFFSGQSGDG